MARRFTRSVLYAAAAGALGLSGCAGTYDLVTSQRFKDRPFHTLFVTDDPMDVLEHVQEGDDRVRAMRNLKEPKENGGTQAQQDRAVAILQEAATVDTRPLVRLAAVQALSRFKDPRVGPILVAAYHQAGRENQGEKREVTAAVAISGIGIKSALTNFTPEMVTNLQCTSLESLGEHRTPESLQLLVSVAGTPTEDKPKPGGIQQAGLVDLEVGTGLDRIDVRLAAIRALGNYTGDPNAVRALIAVLKTDKDVAVRGRATEALCKITGQDLPPDANAWQAWADKSGKK